MEELLKEMSQLGWMLIDKSWGRHNWLQVLINKLELASRQTEKIKKRFQEPTRITLNFYSIKFYDENDR